jgi:hypothetical protein
MKITGANITDIIIYLYEKRLGQTPDSEVIQSWSNLSDAEAQMHLEQLFKSWGYDEAQMQLELAYFQENTQHSSSEYPANDYSQFNTDMQQQSNAAPQAAQKPKGYNPPPQTNSRKSKKWLWFLLLPILAAGTYTAYKYDQFKSLNYLYVTTDNVSVRNHEGGIIGRMDIFPSKNSVSFLRTTDHKTYPIKVGENYYDCRRVVFDTTKFTDFLFEKPEAFGYVNENYLIDNKDDFILYRNVFKEINTAKNENSVLTAQYRRTIVGSIRRNEAFKDLYILNTCNNKSKEFSSLIKIKVKDNIFQVVAQLSDNKYYLFTGQPETQTFDAPQPFLIKPIGQDQLVQLQGAPTLFKLTNKVYYLYDCVGLSKEFYVTTNEDGLIHHARYAFEP